MKVLNLDVKNVLVPVVFEKSSSLSVVCLKLVFKVAGGFCEDKPGLAKMVASVLNEGDRSMGCSGFAKELEKRAIGLNASSGFETFSIEIDCLKEHFEFAVSMLKKLLKEPNLTDEILKKCKTITLGDIANNQNDNDYLAKCGLFEILYKDTNLQYPSIGTQISIDSINLDDIRKFIDENLGLDNLFLVFGGDIDESDINTLKDSLSVLKNSSIKTLTKLKTSDKEEQKEILKQSEQAYVYFGSPYDVGDDERYMAGVATFILGEGGFGSRLMEQIRVKRGLAYSVYARNLINLSHSQIYGYLQTKNESKDEAISVVKDEFYKFIQNGVTKRELEQAKKFLLGSLPLRLETMFRRLDIAQNEFYRGLALGTFLSELKRIESLKLNEINSFIQRHSEISKLSFCVLRDNS